MGIAKVPQAGGVEEFEEADEEVVAFGFKFVDGAAFGEAVASVNDFLGEFVGQFGGFEEGPGGLEGGAKLVDEVGHAAFAAAQVEDGEGPHHCPAQAGAVADGHVYFFDRRHVVVDHVQDFPPDCFHDPVGDKAGDFFGEFEGLFAGGAVDVHRALVEFGAGLCPRDDFDDGHEVRRVERVGDDAPFGVADVDCHFGHAVAGRAGGDEAVRGRGGVYGGEGGDFEGEPFGDVFLDEFGVGDGFFEGGDEVEFVRVGVGVQADPGERGPDAFDFLAEAGFGIRGRVVGGDGHPVAEEVRGPARANDAGANDGDAGGEVNGQLRISNSEWLKGCKECWKYRIGGLYPRLFRAKKNPPIKGGFVYQKVGTGLRVRRHRGWRWRNRWDRSW